MGRLILGIYIYTGLPSLQALLTRIIFIMELLQPHRRRPIIPTPTKRISLRYLHTPIVFAASPPLEEQ
jgi:hypothetical protein